MTDTSLLQDFIAETGEHLEVTERNLLHLEQQPDDTAALNEIFRSVHTIKGSSEYLGMERIAELSHRLESLLDLLRRGERAVDGAVIDLLISGNDRIGQLVGELDQHQAEQSAIDDLLSRIEGYTAPTGTDAQGQVDGEGGQLEDEVDEELFGIFIEQLKDGLESIEQDIRQLVSGEDARTVFERCSEQLSTLRSSANYMGYDELKALYDRWSETLAVLNAGDALDIDAVVEEAIVSNFKSIQAMFPKVGALAPLVEAVQSLKGAAALPRLPRPPRPRSRRRRRKQVLVRRPPMKPGNRWKPSRLPIRACFRILSPRPASTLKQRSATCCIWSSSRMIPLRSTRFSGPSIPSRDHRNTLAWSALPSCPTGSRVSWICCAAGSGPSTAP
jgi:chemotaxis protein histidine kinase CheA